MGAASAADPSQPPHLWLLLEYLYGSSDLLNVLASWLAR